MLLLLAPSISLPHAQCLRPYELYSLGSHHTIKNGKACIFIHGTTNIVPIIEPLLGRFVDEWLLDKAKILCDAWPLEFTRDSFYMYRWPGDFNINVRKKAAQHLYDAICNHKGSLTIIGHSHGCSIALYLAELCQMHKNTSFKVDKLILLAPPVQDATAPLVKSKIFKRVFSFYSSSDFLQIIAPQRVERRFAKKRRKVLCGSQRVFPRSSNLIQARVLINHENPSHLDFCCRFLRKLPSVITFLEQPIPKNKQHVILNVPTNSNGLSFLQKEELDWKHLSRLKRERKRRLNGRHKCRPMPF